MIVTVGSPYVVPALQVRNLRRDDLASSTLHRQPVAQLEIKLRAQKER